MVQRYEYKHRRNAPWVATAAIIRAVLPLVTIFLHAIPFIIRAAGNIPLSRVRVATFLPVVFIRAADSRA